MDEIGLPLPGAMMERARAFRGEPVPARRAATVVLMRPADDGFEVYLLRRVATMVFGGVYAFPGGGVDPTDDPPDLRTDWPDRLGQRPTAARALVGAAVRELFEETGVLLASPADGDLEADRKRLHRREQRLTDLLDRHGLRIRDDLLRPWSRWITPAFEPRRFDTYFFVAALPDGQQARDVSGEADATLWVNPRNALNGDLTMLPPTVVTLRELAAYPDIGAVLAAAERRDAARPVTPRVEVGADGVARLYVGADQPKRPVM
jgi:8-oxo-dGTP pyrophosphatase MutT (NUDIX family)